MNDHVRGAQGIIRYGVGGWAPDDGNVTLFQLESFLACFQECSARQHCHDRQRCPVLHTNGPVG